MKIPDGQVIYIGRQKITGEISDAKARALGIKIPEPVKVAVKPYKYGSAENK
jgi:hypothetical protein